MTSPNVDPPSDKEEEEEAEISANINYDEDYNPPKKSQQKTTIANWKPTSPSGPEEVAIVLPAKACKPPKVFLSDLCQLQMIDKERVQELEDYCADPDPLSSLSNSDNAGLSNNGSNNDDNNDDYGPIFKSWAARSLSTEDFVKSGTNFTIHKFQILWTNLQHIMKSKWNIGSGKKSTIHPMDALLMTLTQLKQGSTYNLLAKAFGCPGSKMPRLVTNVVTLCSEDVYKHFHAKESMLKYCGRKIMFNKFLDCIKAINVTFQHGYQHGTNNPEQHIWYSGKHGALGFKTEVAVGSDGQARYAFKSYPGSYHDFKIFKDAINKHLEQLVKDKGDQKEQDNMSVDALEEQYQWGHYSTRDILACRSLDSSLYPASANQRRH